MAHNRRHEASVVNLVTRVVLGYLLALPFIAPLVARSLPGSQGHAFLLRMSATTAGPLQLFYNVGAGYSEQSSTGASLVVSNQPFEYRLPLPPATYRSFRIDPGVAAGTYTIEHAAILDADGSTHVTIPLMELQVMQQLTVLERTPGRLVLLAPDGANDPMLAWMPSSSIRLALRWSDWLRLLAWPALMWIGGVALASGVAWIRRTAWKRQTGLLELAQAFGASNPSLAVVAAAFLATIVATYPLLFASRSLASPANGGMMMLYETPPFLPGSADFEVEDVRTADVGAFMWQTVTHARVEQQALLMGEVPLWNRYTALGRPLWGQGLSGILDPLQWLTFLGSEPAPGWDLKFVAHRFVFGVGVGLASLAATGAWPAAALAAVAAPFAGAFAYRFNHPAVFSLAYAPWALLGWFLVARATSLPALARAAIALSLGSSLLLVAATPKEGALALLGISMTGALAVLLSAGSWPLRGRRILAAAVAGVCVVLLTAPHWLVFLDALHASAHAYEEPRVILGRLIQFVGLWVSPVMPGGPQPGLHLFGLMLVAAALTAPLRLWEDRSSVASAIGAALLIALAFGLVPASSLITLPFISQVGHLYDLLLMAALTPLLVVSATGARVLWSASGSRVVVATIATMAASWLLVQTGALGPVTRFEPWAIALLMPLAIAWPACLLAARRGSAAAILAATGATLALLLPGGLHLEVGTPAIDQLLLQPRPRVPLAESSPAIDAIHAVSGPPTRTTGLGFTLFAGTHVLYGVEDLRGADPLEVPAIREFIDASGMPRPWYWMTSFDAADLPRMGPVLDMLNVGFLLVRADGIPAGAHVLPMQGPDLIRAIQRPTPWPRAFFVDRASTYTTLSDLFQQVRSRRAPFAAVLEGDARAAEGTNQLPREASRAVPADHYELTANTTTFRIRANTEGIAVLGETYLPEDFVATLNRRPVPYFRVNHVFKAVRIPGPGEWEIRFEYRPRRWGSALGAAGIGVVILIALGAVAWRGRAPVAETAPAGRVDA